MSARSLLRTFVLAVTGASLTAVSGSIAGCTTNVASNVDAAAADAASEDGDSHLDSGDAGAGDGEAGNAFDCRPIPTSTHDAAPGVCPSDGGLNGVLVNQPCSDTCAECPTVGVFGPCVCNGTKWGCASDVRCSNDGSRSWYGGLPPATCP